MKYIILIAFAAGSVCYAELLDIRGSVKNSLGQPIENAAVRIFKGYQGLDDFITTDNIYLYTDKDGRYSGQINGPASHLYRYISYSGYITSKNCGDWNTKDDSVILVKKITLTDKYFAEMRSLPVSQRKSKVLELLASQWDSKGINISLEFFIHGDYYRDALLSATTNQNKTVSEKALRLLSYIGNKDDISLFESANGCMHPKEEISASNLDDALYLAAESLAGHTGNIPPTFSRKIFNSNKNRVFSSCTITDNHNGVCEYCLVLSYIEKQWIFTHYFISVIYKTDICHKK